jgi:hypothetical protein
MPQRKLIPLLIASGLLLSALGPLTLARAADTPTPEATATVTATPRPTVALTLAPNSLTVVVPTLALQAAPSATPTPAPESLASSPIIWLAVIAAALVVLGGYLVWRRQEKEKP